MLEISLSHLPKRSQKPRSQGISMVMDKGLSMREAQDLIQVASGLIDFIKLGFGTAQLTQNVAEKIKIYQDAGIAVYLGGTFFEAFLVRNMLPEYKDLLKRLQLTTVEVSDGSIRLEADKKCALIEDFAKDFQVLSEVGSKNNSILIEPKKWIRLMQQELEAGAYKVIAEARESGNVGIYRSNGKAHKLLIDRILSKVDPSKIIWEAPQKSQQVYFIKLLGAEVNLGNIAPNELIACEALRLGLRGDTFFEYLPTEIRKIYEP